MKTVPASTLSPAGPAIRKPTATSCRAVFHFATRLTGTLTFSSARNSRRPETRISRHKITIAAQSAECRMVPSATSMSRQAATSSLSAMGSSMRPSADCWA